MADRYDDTLILGYLEGDLSDADRARLEKQMAEDAALATLVERMRDDRAAMRRLPTEEPPMGLADAAMSMEERSMLLGDPDPAAPRATDPAGEEIRRFRLHRTASYLAIAALVVICGGVVLVSLTTDPWPESGTRWLNEKGLALGGDQPSETAPVLGVGESMPAVSKSKTTPASEELLAGTIKERRDGQTQPLGRVATSPAPAAADMDAAPATAEPGRRAVASGLMAPPQPRDEAIESMGRARAMAPATLEAEQDRSGNEMGLAQMPPPTVPPRANELRALAPQPQRHVQRVNTVVVDVDTKDAQRTRAEVADWVTSNYAIIEPAVSENALLTEERGIDDAARPHETLTVLVDERQVPQLLNRLNERPGQRANLVSDQTSATPVRLELQAAVTSALDELKRFSADTLSEDELAERIAMDPDFDPLTDSLSMAPSATTADQAEAVAIEAEAFASSRERTRMLNYRSFTREESLPVRTEPWSLIDAANFTTRVELRIKPATPSETESEEQ